MDERAAAWAACGAMVLTGRQDGPPLGAPARLIDLVAKASTIVTERGAGQTRLDGLALLGERAAISGFGRHGHESCGGATRLLPAADGWIAVTLARQEDIDALPAWLERSVPADPWPAVAAAVATSSVATLDERAALLGLPFAALGSVSPPVTMAFGLPVGATQLGLADPLGSVDGAIVLDLSALWAGPLCGQLLATAGAHVIKVESTARPDGARQGPAAFFDLLNGPKRSVALDLRTASGVAALRRLLADADVVIESARPRALEQLGIVAADMLRAQHGPRVWASITGHGRQLDRAARVAFGDGAAVAGGLVAGDGQGPCLLADAVADPLTGLVTAAVVLEALAVGGRWLVDAAMAPLAASAAGDLLDVTDRRAAPPRTRSAVCAAPAFGADTTAVLARLPT